MINKLTIKRILVIGLSNIGDAILTSPVIAVLRKKFPSAHLALLVGPRAFAVFKNDGRIDKKIIYDKTIHWKNKLRLVNRLRQDKYDLVVDLRNTGFSVFLGARYRTSIFKKPPKSLVHMIDRHLWKLKSLGIDVGDRISPSVMFSDEDKQNAEKMLKRWQIKQNQNILAVACGSRNTTKRWEKSGFIQLIQKLVKKYKLRIIIIGDSQDSLITDEIIQEITPKPINACGKTTIGELACILSKCRLLVSNDSAPMHLAWAMNTPVVSIFGPTDYRKYAPRGKYDVAIYQNLECYPCEKSLCPSGTRECMKLISTNEVFAACEKVLDLPSPS